MYANGCSQNSMSSAEATLCAADLGGPQVLDKITNPNPPPVLYRGDNPTLPTPCTSRPGEDHEIDKDGNIKGINEGAKKGLSFNTELQKIPARYRSDKYYTLPYDKIPPNWGIIPKSKPDTHVQLGPIYTVPGDTYNGVIHEQIEPNLTECDPNTEQ